nr:very short patch repair endonuclease [Microvirga ossetica]
MSRIRSRNTKPELLLRRTLHAAGLRFRLHPQHLAGRPDLAFPKYRAVAFVHGCFWHGHNCPMFKLPATRTEFWEAKISRNRARDQLISTRLIADGWRVLTVWECALRGPARLPIEDVTARCSHFLRSSHERELEVIGRWLQLERS